MQEADISIEQYNNCLKEHRNIIKRCFIQINLNDCCSFVGVFKSLHVKIILIAQSSLEKNADFCFQPWCIA